jgi:uncharacterized membrane protein YccC
MGQAVRQAGRFDRSAVSLRDGLVAAIPVVVLLAGGTAVGDSVAAVTMGAGAMLVGVAWRAGGGRPPLAAMATTTAVMGLSTFAGAASGQYAWLHFAIVGVWSFVAGLLVALGPRGGTVGLQAIIAIIVFGRFPQPLGSAAGLAGLVVAGGAAQVLFCAVVGLSPGLRHQRSALAAAYRRLASLATSGGVSVPVSVSLDEAQATLSSPALIGDAAIIAFSNLVIEGRRIRLELLGLELLVDQYIRAEQTSDTGLPDAIARLRETTARALHAIADVVESGDAAAARRLRSTGSGLIEPRDAVVTAAEHDHAVLAARIAEHAAALAGQVRAVVGLATAAPWNQRERIPVGLPGARNYPGRPGTRQSRRSSGAVERLREGIDQVRANASLNSTAGRHAVRLAVVVAVTELLARHLPIQRSYWMVVAAAAVLKPEFGATFTRGAERVLGTCVGALGAGLLIVGVHPSGWATVGLVGLLAWAAYAIFPASFAAGVAFLTGMIVFLLNVVTADTLATAVARGLDTIIGGAIGLLAYAVWPTWSRVPARAALAQLVSAQRSYLKAVLDPLVQGVTFPESAVSSAARRARLAWTNAEATVTRSLTEPMTRRIDAEQSRGLLAGLRRLVYAAHVIRLEASRYDPQAPHPELGPLACTLDESLARITNALGPESLETATLPPLRALYQTLSRESAGQPADAVLMAELDEIVDATNTVSELVGLEPTDASTVDHAPAEGN